MDSSYFTTKLGKEIEKTSKEECQMCHIRTTYPKEYTRMSSSEELFRDGIKKICRSCWDYHISLTESPESRW